MYILGMETSCDDTSVCLGKKHENGKFEIIDLQTLSMYDSLKPFGGIVPEIVSRNHVRKIAGIIQNVLQAQNLTASQLDYLAVTTLPGLLGALLTGINAAKTLSLIHHLPIVEVNHLFAHISAIHLTQKIQFPYLALLVSGGHTILFWCQSPTDYEILGSTNDDAAGEAFDKGGKLLGLSYPAGPIIDRLAKEGDQNFIQFPVGLKGQKNCNFSFSGIKTSLRYKIEESTELNKLVEENKQQLKDNKPIQETSLLKNVCASYQKSIVEALTIKTKQAMKLVLERNPQLSRSQIPVVVGGGVACNSKLRTSFEQTFGKNVFFVEPKYCTDNAAMITHHASLILDQAKPFPSSLDIIPHSRYINKKDYR